MDRDALRILSLVALTAACAPPPTEAAGPAAFDLAAARVVDLSHAYDRDTLYWPTSPSRFELTELSRGETPGGWFYAANALATPEHGGTHLDAPWHFAAGGRKADEIPLGQLVAPAVVIDARAACAGDDDWRLDVATVTAWEAEHGTVPRGAIVLLRTGWAERWPDARAYLGDDTPGDASDLHFPSYGLEAADLLIRERGVAALGVDTASIDPGDSDDFPVHRLAGRHDVPGLENVAHLDEVPATGAWVAALPMKIAGGSGGPVRIAAFVPDDAR